jgi:hypothetical protein
MEELREPIPSSIAAAPTAGGSMAVVSAEGMEAMVGAPEIESAGAEPRSEE